MLPHAEIVPECVDHELTVAQLEIAEISGGRKWPAASWCRVQHLVVDDAVSNGADLTLPSAEPCGWMASLETHGGHELVKRPSSRAISRSAGSPLAG